MDLTQGTPQQKNNRAKKMMLWFGIVSLIMTFGGLTSAFIVSSTREDWLKDFVLPEAFTYSTILILLSSIVLYVAKKAIIKEQRTLSTSLLLGVFILGVAFIYYERRRTKNRARGQRLEWQARRHDIAQFPPQNHPLAASGRSRRISGDFFEASIGRGTTVWKGQWL